MSTLGPERERIEAPAQDRIDPRVWRAAAVAVLGPLMAQMDSTLVNVSLSAIQQDLGTAIDTVQWVVSGYLLALALTLPLNGWLVDRIGAKRLYLACFTGFALASLLCGSGQDGRLAGRGQGAAGRRV